MTYHHHHHHHQLHCHDSNHGMPCTKIHSVCQISWVLIVQHSISFSSLNCIFHLNLQNYRLVILGLWLHRIFSSIDLAIIFHILFFRFQLWFTLRWAEVVFGLHYFSCMVDSQRNTNNYKHKCEESFHGWEDSNN